MDAELPLVARDRDRAVDAVEVELGGPQEYFEVTASDPQAVQLFVAGDGGPIGDDLRVRRRRAGASERTASRPRGSRSSVMTIDFDPATVLEQVDGRGARSDDRDVQHHRHRRRTGAVRRCSPSPRRVDDSTSPCPVTARCSASPRWVSTVRANASRRPVAACWYRTEEMATWGRNTKRGRSTTRTTTSRSSAPRSSSRPTATTSQRREAPRPTPTASDDASSRAGAELRDAVDGPRARVHRLRTRSPSPSCSGWRSTSTSPVLSVVASRRSSDGSPALGRFVVPIAVGAVGVSFIRKGTERQPVPARRRLGR